MATASKTQEQPKKTFQLQEADPPKMKRGRESTPIPTEELDAWIEGMQTHSEKGATDGVLYATKGKAQSKAQKLKAAILEYADLADGTKVSTRVWEDKTEEGKFRFSLRLRQE